MRGLIIVATALIAGSVCAVDLTLGETFTPAFQELVESAVQPTDNALGLNATATTGGAVGDQAVAGSGGAMGEGSDAWTGGAIGFAAIADTGGAVGESAYAEQGFSGGFRARSAIEIDAIQLGTGTNSYDHTLKIYDNTLLLANGNIPIARMSAEGDIRYPRSIYGELHVHDSSAITNDIPNGTTYTRLPWSNIGFTNGVTASTATSNMTLTVNGRYQVTGTFCFSGEGVSVVWKGAVFQDNVEQDQIHFLRKIGTGGDQGAAPFSGFLSVTNQPAVIDFRVRHDYQIGARENYVTYANFGVVYIGEE